jgi:hypothetical protein
MLVYFSAHALTRSCSRSCSRSFFSLSSSLLLTASRRWQGWMWRRRIGVGCCTIRDCLPVQEVDQRPSLAYRCHVPHRGSLQESKTSVLMVKVRRCYDDPTQHMLQSLNHNNKTRPSHVEYALAKIPSTRSRRVTLLQRLLPIW